MNSNRRKCAERTKRVKSVWMRRGFKDLTRGSKTAAAALRWSLRDGGLLCAFFASWHAEALRSSHSAFFNSHDERTKAREVKRSQEERVKRESTRSQQGKFGFRWYTRERALRETGGPPFLKGGNGMYMVGGHAHWRGRPRTRWRHWALVRNWWGVVRCCALPESSVQHTTKGQRARCRLTPAGRPRRAAAAAPRRWPPAAAQRARPSLSSSFSSSFFGSPRGCR